MLADGTGIPLTWMMSAVQVLYLPQRWYGVSAAPHNESALSLGALSRFGES